MMAKIIVCPKCGKVDRYMIKEYVSRHGIFDADGKTIDTTEDVGIKYGKPRCYQCNRLVKFEER